MRMLSPCLIRKQGRALVVDVKKLGNLILKGGFVRRKGSAQAKWYWTYVGISQGGIIAATLHAVGCMPWAAATFVLDF